MIQKLVLDEKLKTWFFWQKSDEDSEEAVRKYVSSRNCEKAMNSNGLGLDFWKSWDYRKEEVKFSLLDSSILEGSEEVECSFKKKVFPVNQ